MPPTPQKSATTIPVGERTFVCHLYSSSQALEILLTLGEVIAVPLGKILGRKVSADMDELAAAVDDLQDEELNTASLLGLFGAIRKVGGMDRVVAILQTTYFEDRAIDSRKRFDEVFAGPAGLLDAARLLWRVLVYQLSPLWDGLRPLLSERGGALAGLATRLNSARTSTGESGDQ